MKRIAIQGKIGSFHDIAAHEYFKGEQLQLHCCSTFAEVFDSVRRDPTAIAMLAIENTIAGSLLHNYDLLRESETTVVGEQRLHIQHCICCLPDDDWDTVTEVHSHPVALMQCRSFLAQHSGIKILEDSIEDNKHNFTRFLVVCHPQKAGNLCPLEKADKASIVFSLPHEEGSLSKVLTILSFYDINLTKIQSLPVIGHEWEYLFYVDVTFNNLTRYRQAVDAITPLVKSIKILGEYKES